MEEENKHLAFLNSIKKYDDDQTSESKDSQTTEQRGNECHNTTLQELGFGPDEDDDMQSNNLRIFTSLIIKCKFYLYEE